MVIAKHNATVQPAAGKELSIKEMPDPSLDCNGLQRLGSGLLLWRVTVVAPDRFGHSCAAMAME